MAVDVDPDTRLVQLSTGERFTFDGVCGPECAQDDVFQECRDLVKSAIDGHNVTIFTYGQTGSGKTYTMYGKQGEPGLAYRLAEELFRCIASEEESCLDSFEVAASMSELHNGKLRDLLRPQRSTEGRACTSLGEELQADSATALRRLLDQGRTRRCTSSHALNQESSRSHALFAINVLRRGQDGPARSRIVLCDLGGSERLKRSLVSGKSQQESIEINKSLSALLGVLDAVSRGARQVPYRDHRLTQLLEDSIGGTAKTLMVLNCSPASGGRPGDVGGAALWDPRWPGDKLRGQ